MSKHTSLAKKAILSQEKIHRYLYLRPTHIYSIINKSYFHPSAYIEINYNLDFNLLYGIPPELDLYTKVTFVINSNNVTNFLNQILFLTGIKIHQDEFNLQTIITNDVENTKPKQPKQPKRPKRPIARGKESYRIGNQAFANN